MVGTGNTSFGIRLLNTVTRRDLISYVSVQVSKKEREGRSLSQALFRRIPYLRETIPRS